MERDRPQKSGIKLDVVLLSITAILQGNIGANFFSSKKKNRSFGVGPVSSLIQEVIKYSFYDPKEALRTIHFEEGSLFQKGDLLVDLTSDFENAEQESLESQVNLIIAKKDALSSYFQILKYKGNLNLDSMGGHLLKH